MDALASSTRTAGQVNNNEAFFAGACACDVDEVDVGDVDLGWVRCASRLVDVEVALVKHDGVVGVLNINVLVCDVRDVSDQALAERWEM